MIKLEEFKKYKEVLEETITNKAFRSRMMFEVIDDEIFGMRILKYINIISGNITSEELNNVFNDIRKDTIDYYEKSKKSETKNDKIFFALRSLAYFYFLESMDEHSTLSDGIVEEIQKKYPNDYLEIISTPSSSSHLLLVVVGKGVHLAWSGEDALVVGVDVVDGE